MSSMDSPTERGLVAKEPHCGICEHVRFQGDWDRTPYCVEQAESIEISVGEFCSSFSARSGIDPAGKEADVDVEIDWAERLSGTDAPFYASYRDDERYDWLCGNCRTFDVAVGPMQRVRCTECGNTHRSTEWDAAYL